MSDAAENRLPTVVGDAVRQRRHELGWTTRQLAEAIGSSQPFVSRLENGQLAPGLSALYRLANALGLPPNQLLPRHAESFELVRAGTGSTLAADNAPWSAQLLTGARDRELESYLITVRAGEAEARPFEHEGEDLVIVLDGAVQLRGEVEAPSGSISRDEGSITVSADEIARVNGRVPHEIVSTNGATMLVVSSARSAHDPASTSGAETPSVGYLVNAARSNAKMSMRALARSADVSQPLISKIEHGTTVPSLNTLTAIANALKVSPSTLLPPSNIHVSTNAADGVRSSLNANLLTLAQHAWASRVSTGEELLFSRRGRAQISLEGAILELSEGDCLWLPPRQHYEFRGHPEATLISVSTESI